jgi:hypothetical protein
MIFKQTFRSARTATVLESEGRTVKSAQGRRYN